MSSFIYPPNPNSEFVLTSEQTAAFTAVAGNQYPVSTASAAITVTPPASPSAGQKFSIIDSRATFGTNNCTIGFSAATQKFCGTTQDLALSQNGMVVVLLYVNATIGWTLST